MSTIIPTLIIIIPAQGPVQPLEVEFGKDQIRFFDCGRFRGEHTPIRVGYYLGYRIIDKACKELNQRQLLTLRPTAKMVQRWLRDLD